VVHKFVLGFLKYTNAIALPQQAEAVLWTYDFPFMLAQAMTKAGTVTNTTRIANALRGGVVRDGLIGTHIIFGSDNSAVFTYSVTLVSPTGSSTTKVFN
jgi:hypothetical protein